VTVLWRRLLHSKQGSERNPKTHPLGGIYVLHQHDHALTSARRQSKAFAKNARASAIFEEDLEKTQTKARGKSQHTHSQRKETNMIQPSLEMIQTIQRDYEREAERVRLVKSAKTSKRTSPFVNKHEIGKDLAYLVFRLTAHKRKPTRV
jgi:hypothetical protein